MSTQEGWVGRPWVQIPGVAKDFFLMKSTFKGSCLIGRCTLYVNRSFIKVSNWLHNPKKGMSLWLKTEATSFHRIKNKNAAVLTWFSFCVTTKLSKLMSVVKRSQPGSSWMKESTNWRTWFAEKKWKRVFLSCCKNAKLKITWNALLVCAKLGQVVTVVTMKLGHSTVIWTSLLICLKCFRISALRNFWSIKFSQSHKIRGQNKN